MKRSLARFLILAFSCLVAASTYAHVSIAAPLPKLDTRVLHGDYAIGFTDGDPGRSAYFNLRTKKLRRISKPAGALSLEINHASDVAMVGTTDRSAWSGNPHVQALYRVDIRSGRRQKLDSITPTGVQEIIPISIADDGTVIAAFRLDRQQVFLRQYPPGSAPARDVWIPEKYRPWLGEMLIDANEDSVAIGTSGAGGGPGAVAVIDIAKRIVLVERAAANLQKISLANPHSLFLAQAPKDLYGRQTPGTMKHWRIGEGRPRVLYRGLLAAYKSTNCGNRALVATTRRLMLIDRKGNIVLRRRVASNRSVNLIACSADHLFYKNVRVYGAEGEYPSFSHLLGISKLP